MIDEPVWMVELQFSVVSVKAILLIEAVPLTNLEQNLTLTPSGIPLIVHVDVTLNGKGLVIL